VADQEKKEPEAPPAAEQKPAAKLEVDEKTKERLAKLEKLEAEEVEREKAKLSEAERIAKEKAELAKDRYSLALVKAGIPEDLAAEFTPPAKGDAGERAKDLGKAWTKAVKEAAAALTSKDAAGDPAKGGVGKPRDPPGAATTTTTAGGEKPKGPFLSLVDRAALAKQGGSR
jgi:hypothetical protein